MNNTAMTNQAMPPMELRTHPVGNAQMNAYALICPQTNISVLIDPGAEPEELTKLIAGTKPAAILITHTHGDHVGALETMRQQLQVPVYSAGEPHANDLKFHTDRLLQAGDEFSVGAYTLRVYAGGTKIYDCTTSAFGAAAARRAMSFLLHFVNRGTAATNRLFGQGGVGGNVAPTTGIATINDSSLGAITTAQPFASDLQTVDTSANWIFKVTMQLSVSEVNYGARVSSVLLEVL